MTVLKMVEGNQLIKERILTFRRETLAVEVLLLEAQVRMAAVDSVD